ncbi:MAG: 5'-nucleotidase, lipoprotein e(P4) family [Anaerovoracaceae bacterium]
MITKKRKIFISLLAVAALTTTLCFSGCGQQNTQKSADSENKEVTEQASVTDDFRKESYINGIIYQLSAEVKGLQQQAYDLAKIRLDEKLANKDQYTKPLAIISDIDATLMDDATYMADIVQREGEWDNGPWDYYYDAVGSTGCKALPGAVEFCNYAASKGVEMFYITNRDHDKLDLTVQQLKRAGFPNADEAHVQVMNEEGSSNKTERRDNVTKDHEVLFYMGDNIGDFTADFTREMGPIKRAEMATDDKYKDMWGDKWIVLPNATYGDYVGAVWYNDKESDAAERCEKIKELLDHYKFTNKEFKNWYEAKN